MTQTQKEAYAKIVAVLFDGAVKPQPNQITAEVVEIADKMMSEITTCHNRLKPFAVLANGIAGTAEALLPGEIGLVLGTTSFETYLKDKTFDEVAKALKKSNALSAYKALQAFYQAYLQYTAADRRLKICIVTARVNWRSRMEMAVMGI